MNDAVKEFWDNQAKEHGTSDLATAPDHYYREHEINCILPLLNDGESILDVGCGNGYATLKFAKACPNSSIIGVDYSWQMIEAAIKAKAMQDAPKVLFSVGDILTLTKTKVLDLLPQILGELQFDTIVCTRVLINLKSWEEQQQAILQMKALLKPGGRLILVENTKEGLARLNMLRLDFDLHEIKERWHNCYLPQEKLEEFLESHFYVESSENIGNLYYIISRVVYAKLCHDLGVEPAYGAPINKIASQLPTLSTRFGKNYSPNMMYVLRHD